MDFEFDSEKSKSNLKKHGISFDHAMLIWEDENAIEITAKEKNEPRFLTIGRIDGKHWSAITTLREGNTRIISVRRSRKSEIAIYENE